MRLGPCVSGREINGNEMKRGKSHVTPSRPATMEQKDAYSLDVCDGDGRQVSQKGASGIVCAGTAMSRVQAHVRGVCTTDKPMRALLVVRSDVKDNQRERKLQELGGE